MALATFFLSVLLYGAASGLFFLSIVRGTGLKPVPLEQDPSRFAPTLLAFGAIGHATYVGLASFVARVCPIHSVHFFLSVASLFAIAAYLTFRRRLRIEPLGVLVGPLGLAFLLGTFFLGKPGPEPRLSPLFITLHVIANLLGTALFWLAGGAAALYLVQEKRLKQKRASKSRLPPLDTLDRAVHRFLVAGFPFLTMGIITGTIRAQSLEAADMRSILGYALWLLIGAVLLLRVTAGWRGRRAAYGTIAGLVGVTTILVIYALRPSAAAGG
jgi:ABC-type uncharacterized transport system permease subunit